MSTFPNPYPHRTWKDVARDLARETDRKRISELADELNDALDPKELDAPPELDS